MAAEKMKMGNWELGTRRIKANLWLLGVHERFEV